MIEISRSLAILLALLFALWLCLGVWGLIAGGRGAALRRSARAESQRASALLASSPAVAMIVLPKGEIEASPKLAAMLGLDEVPAHLDGFVALGLDPALEDLSAQVRSVSKTGARFSLKCRLADESRMLLLRGAPAAPPFPPGSVVLWFTDETEPETEIETLRAEGERLSGAVEALSGVIEVAPFPVWYRGPDLRLVMVNSAYVAAVEADDAATVVSGGIELVDETEGESPIGHAAAVRDRGEPSSRSVPATVAGERRMMRVVEVPVGQSGVAGYAIDIEDREQARADLARFVRAQRDMLDRLSAGVAQFGRDRSLDFFNQPFARLFSLKAEFLADQPEFNRVLDSMRESGNLPEVRDYPEWKTERARWFTSGLAADEEDWLLPGGKHLRVVAQPLPDGGLLLIFEDRTEQIQLASARDTLLRVRTATFDNLFEAVGVFASDGRLHLWNNRFRELWNFEEEQLAAHPRVDAMTPLIARKLKNPNHASVVRELVRSATVERKQRSGRVSLIDGREFEFAAVPLPDGNALFAMLDVTASRTVESALRDRNEALEEADRLKTAFVSNMSYELRTPLTSIAGFAEMLAGGYAGELPPNAVDYVRAILESVARLSTLIDNVLDLTQSDTGSLLLAEERVDLYALCNDAAEEARPLAATKSIDLRIDTDPSVGEITGDRTRLRQVLHNLLENAFAYTPEGGRVLLHASGTAEEVAIAVSDNGRGIPLHDQAHVFDRFYRNMLGGSGSDGALGLGLPLAKQFVEAHGGTIALESEPGSGTTVTLRLPRTAP